MSTERTTQTVLFPDLFEKPIEAKLDLAHSSSDGGALLLKAVDSRLQLTERLAEALVDTRQAAKARHSVLDLLRQRVFSIALGYPDGNDATALRDDPILKLALDRDPARGVGLGSQPTISRFENAVQSTDLYRLADTLADIVIDRHRRRLGSRCRRITLDFDPTDDPTHGQQGLSFYHGYYDTHCYLPLIGTISFGNEAEQSLICALLRPGNAGAALGLVSILDRLLPKIRRAFRRAKILVRLDGGFGTPAVLDYLDQAGVEYVVGLVTTKALKERAKRAQAGARRRFRERGETISVFGDTRYKTKTTWPEHRRVVFKAEVVQYPGRTPRENLRFVVTNLTQSAKHVYRTYVGRGDAENRIKGALGKAWEEGKAMM